MHAENVLKLATSECGAAVIFTRKKDRSPRFCVDYRKLHDVTVCDSYHLSRIEKCIDRLGEPKMFSTLDGN